MKDSTSGLHITLLYIFCGVEQLLIIVLPVYQSLESG
mgnify:FL=1